MSANGVVSFARLCAAAGVLFFDAFDRVLIVKPTYKLGWDIPGGYVEQGESPRNAAIREVREELGITARPGALLAVDWAPCREGDKLLFVFDGGQIEPDDLARIKLDGVELDDFTLCDTTALAEYMPPRLTSRITSAIDNRGAPLGTYVEHGRRPADVPGMTPNGSVSAGVVLASVDPAAQRNGAGGDGGDVTLAELVRADPDR